MAQGYIIDSRSPQWPRIEALTDALVRL